MLDTIYTPEYKTNGPCTYAVHTFALRVFPFRLALGSNCVLYSCMGSGFKPNLNP